MPHPTSQKLENRARRWMVAQEWLAKPENKVYDIPSRILDNGKAWGDEHDPEELINKAKEIAAAKKEIRDGKRVKLEMMEAAVLAKGDVKGKAKARGGKQRRGKQRRGRRMQWLVVRLPLMTTTMRWMIQIPINHSKSRSSSYSSGSPPACVKQSNVIS